MKTTTSTPMLWTEMTDDLAESVNGGRHCRQSYSYCEKPKKEYCESYYEEPSYCYEDKKYDHCNSYQSKW